MDGPIIRGAWYSPARRQLDILFSGGRRYRYRGVPRCLAEQFGEAAAKMRFFNREIRDRYACTPLDAPLPQAA